MKIKQMPEMKWLDKWLLWLDKLFDFCEVLDKPKKWPRLLRRIFILTLPIAVPLWFILWIIHVVILIIVALASGLLCWAIELWSDPK